MRREVLGLALVLVGCGKTDLLERPGGNVPPPIAPPINPPINPPIASPPIQQDCTISISQFGNFAIDFRFDTFREPLSSGGNIVFHRRTGRGGGVDIAAIDPESGSETELVFSESDDLIVDARGASLLAFTSSSEGFLRLFTADGEVIALDSGSALFSRIDPFIGAQIRMVEDRRAVWTRGGGELFFFDGRESRRIPSERPFVFSPYLRGERIAFSANAAAGIGNDVFIVTHNRAELVRYDGRPRDARDEFPVLGERDLFFVSNGRILRKPLAGGQVEILHPGPCGPPSVEGDVTVFACGLDGAPALSELFIYDSALGVRRVPTPGGFIHVARASGGIITWIAYTDPNATCFGNAEGRVFANAIPPDFDWHEPLVIATVGAPCLCCDSIWPPLELSLEANLLSWGYDARNPEANPSRPSAIGFAILDRECRQN